MQIKVINCLDTNISFKIQLFITRKYKYYKHCHKIYTFVLQTHVSAISDSEFELS